MKLYRKYLSVLVKSAMQYKASFFMTVLGQLLLSGTAVLAVYFLMSRFRAVDGFTLGEVMLCFGTVYLAFGLAELFVRGFDTFPSMLGNGEFDRIMVRPRGLVFQVLASKFDLSRLGRLVQALVIFCYAVPASGVHWTAARVVLLALMPLCGALVFGGLFVVYAALTFFTVDGLEVMNVFTDGGREFGSYPFSVYGGRVLKFLTCVVPLALFQYYPLLYLTGRSSSVLCFFAPLLSLLFLVPCGLLWRLGVRRYKSTGS